MMPIEQKWFPLLRQHAIALLIMMISLCSAAGTGFTTSSAPVVRESGLLRVEAPEGTAVYAQHIIEHATAALRQLNQATGDPLLTRILFIITTDHKQFEEYAGGQAEQSLAVALGGRQTIVVSRPAMARTGAAAIQQVLLHELAHIYLDVRCRGPVPRWVHEGVAQIIAGQVPEAQSHGAMSLAAYTGGLLPLEELVEGFPNSGVRRQQAYAQSQSAMQFVIRERHENSMQRFLGAVSGDAGQEYLATFSRTADLKLLHKDWQASLRSPGAILTVILGHGVFWGFAAFLVVVAWFVVRRRSKDIRRRWAAEEAMAAEWNEPPDEAEWIKGDWTENPPDDLDDDDDDEFYYEEDDGESWKRQ